MEQFTASEVRDWERAYKGTGAAKVFGAFADLLEAQEKAVPVMVVNHVSSAEHDLPIGMKLYAHPAPADTDWKNNVLAGDMKAIVDGDGNVLYVNKKIFDREVERTNEALATVSALTADTERLAEALRQIAREPRKPWPDPFGHSHEAFARAVHATWCDMNRIACAALATHSTQAQPPAASVTDAMVGRAQDCLHDKGKDIGYYHMRAALEAALAAQENPNG